MRRELPFIMLFTAGMLVLMAYFIPNIGIGGYTLGTTATTINSWVVLLRAWLMGVAAISLFRYNANKAIRAKWKSPESISVCLGLLITAVLIILRRYATGLAFVAPFYANLFSYFVQSAGNAIFSLLAFYVASASYRAFRARTVEATFMLAAAVLVMIGSAPLGEVIWSGFGPINTWLLNVPNVAGTRGLLICAAVGAFSTSLKVLLGLERGAIGGSEHS